MSRTERGVDVFSYAEGMGAIQTDETPKNNTFQTMRKEVSGMAVFRRWWFDMTV